MNTHSKSCQRTQQLMRGGMSQRIQEDIHQEARQRARELALQEEAEQEAEAQRQEAEEHRARIEVRMVTAQYILLTNIHVRRNVKRKEYEPQLSLNLHIAVLDDNDARLKNFKTWFRQVPHISLGTCPASRSPHPRPYLSSRMRMKSRTGTGTRTRTRTRTRMLNLVLCHQMIS